MSIAEFASIINPIDDLLKRNEVETAVLVVGFMCPVYIMFSSEVAMFRPFLGF